MDPGVAQRIFAASTYAARPQRQRPGQSPFSGGGGFNRGSVSGLAALDMIMGAGPQRKVTPFGHQIAGVGGGGFTGSPEMMISNAAGGPASFSAPSQQLLRNMQRTNFQAPAQRQAPQLQTPAPTQQRTIPMQPGFRPPASPQPTAVRQPSASSERAAGQRRVVSGGWRRL